MPKSLVLASASPRRQELLERLGLSFSLQPADVDESVHPAEPAERYVERVARAKADAVARRGFEDACVLAADTSVVADEAVLGKPTSDEDAAQMLRRLSGRSHRVITGVALGGVRRAYRAVTTTVHFEPLTDAQIRWYVETGEPTDKAGAYAIQGIGGAFVRAVEGSVSNVVGLPLAETLALLAEAGIPLPWSQP